MRYLLILIASFAATAGANPPPQFYTPSLPANQAGKNPPDWVLEIVLRKSGKIMNLGFHSKEACEAAILRNELEFDGYDGKCVDTTPPR